MVMEEMMRMESLYYYSSSIFHLVYEIYISVSYLFMGKSIHIINLLFTLKLLILISITIVYLLLLLFLLVTFSL